MNGAFFPLLRLPRFVAAFFSAFLFVFGGYGAEGDWTFRSWQSDKGLPDNTVVGVEPGADGFLWVATRSGLTRFDGIQFREFSSAATVASPTSLLYATCLDRSNRLWVAKERGVIVCIDHGRTTALTPADGLLELPVRMMVVDREGSVWVSYLEGGLVVRIQGRRVEHFAAEAGLPGGSTCQLASDRDGQLWYAQGTNMGVFLNGKFQSLNLDKQGQRIAAARDGGIWLYGLVQRELFKYVPGRGLVSMGKLPVSRAGVNATVIYEDRTGAVWIGTGESGLFRYDGRDFSPVATSHYNIICITEDREGNLWVGTQGGGLNRIQPRAMELLDVGSSIAYEAVRSVCQDTVGNLWATTASGVLVQNKGAGWTAAAASLQNAILYAQCVAASPRGGIWVGSQYKGLFYFSDGELLNIPRSAGLAAQSVRSLLAGTGGEVWIGTESPNALQRWRDGRLQNFDLPAGSGFISAMAVDVAGVLWAGTTDGRLLKCDRDVIIEATASTFATPEAIRSLCATPDGSLWIGYGGHGLGRLHGDGFVSFGVEQGLFDDYISQIAADNRGRLWFGGNRGMFYVHQSEFTALESGSIKRLRSIVSGLGEGFPNLQANHGFSPGAFITTNGNLLVPTLSGLLDVKLDRLRQNLRMPQVYLTRVTLDGQLVAAYEMGEVGGGGGGLAHADLGSLNPALTISPNHQRLEFEFTAPNFTSPENVFFKYRLQGLDRDWIEVGNRREANYSHLPAGDYKFQVKACNATGNWSEYTAVLTIKALPHYWETWTFRFVAGGLACGLLAAVVATAVRSRHRRRIEQLERQQAMERERTRIAQDLHDDLGSGLTEISFESEFAQDPSLDIEETRHHTREIGGRARELVAALDEIVWAVNPKNDTVPSLASYLTQFSERFLKHTPVRSRLDVARDLPEAPLNADERHNLFLAFKEALHNVVQHAKAANVQLTIRIEAGALVIIVRDNGCGFDPGSAHSEADGLGNMRRRMERIGGSFELESVQGEGSAVTLRFPLRHSAP